MQAYQDLYNNTMGMRDDFVKFWSFSAMYFRDLPIIGYEVLAHHILLIFKIINEPFAGDIYHDPALLLPGVAGHQNLQPFYEVVARAIRASDPDHLVFFEPVTWGMVLNGNITGSGFSGVPGGPALRPKSVFSVHYYCWFLDAAKGQFIRGACDKDLAPQVSRCSTFSSSHRYSYSNLVR